METRKYKVNKKGHTRPQTYNTKTTYCYDRWINEHNLTEQKATCEKRRCNETIKDSHGCDKRVNLELITEDSRDEGEFFKQNSTYTSISENDVTVIQYEDRSCEGTVDLTSVPDDDILCSKVTKGNDGIFKHNSDEPLDLSCSIEEDNEHDEVCYDEDKTEDLPPQLVDDIISIDDLISDITANNKWQNIPEEFEDFETENPEGVNESFDEFASQQTTTPDKNDPIYPGHSLDVNTSFLLIWLYIITHSLTGGQAADLLALINLHLLVKHPALDSMYKFKQFFKNIGSPLIKHYYCSFCFTSVDTIMKVCPNTSCLQNLDTFDSKGYFIEISIIEQMKNFFSMDDFCNNLQHRFTRQKKHESNIEDIYDGDLYCKLAEKDGPLSAKYPNNISFTFNTDGVPVFSSSKVSMWPIYLQVNELPFKMRIKRENMLLCGLWLGKSKPPMHTFCDPLHKNLIQLEHGMTLDLKDRCIKFCAFLICMAVDLPARSQMLNMNQFNGEFSCVKCYQRGQNLRTATGGNVRVFPYNQDCPLGQQRTMEEFRTQAKQGLDTQKTVYGVKGPSFIMFCPIFDFIKGTSLDYMHQLLLGITRMMLKLWFTGSHSSETFSMFNFISLVDSRLTAVKPPNTISRMPRSIADDLSHWKAAELRSWLLYYSVPIIRDIMRPAHLYHYCALVEGIFLLLQNSISDDDLQRSEQLLKYYVFMMPGLYAERYVTLNVHNLLHLPACVRDLGPLWASSCFSFENANGELLRMFHGTQYIDLQIMNAAITYQLLPTVCNITSESPVYSLVKSLLDLKPKKINSQVYVIGKGYNKTLTLEMQTLLRDNLEMDSTNLLFYKRAYISDTMYHSKDYTRVSVRNSYTVKYSNSRGITCFGYVVWYAKPNDEEKTICLIEKLEVLPVNLFKLGDTDDLDAPATNFLNLHMSHLHSCCKTNSYDVIQAIYIRDLCINIQIGDIVYICEEPNREERNL